MKDKKCVVGCKAYSGGEMKHHKDCDFYPDSLSQKYDKMEQQLEKERDENKELKDLIYVDDDECRFDHHGFCQTHMMDAYKSYKCGMIRIRELTND